MSLGDVFLENKKVEKKIQFILESILLALNTLQN